MSKVDDTFDFANSLVLEWGQDAVFVRKTNSVYDPNTGEVTQNEQRFRCAGVTRHCSQGVGDAIRMDPE